MVATTQNNFAHKPSLLSKQYAAAASHALFIAKMRKRLPLAGFIVFGLFAAFTLINPFAFSLPFEVERFSLKGTRLIMENPYLTGYTKDKKGYKIKAERAEQDIKVTNIIELFAIHADVEIEGGVATLNAKEGVMQTDKEQLNLKNGVRITTTTGYAGLTQEAQVNPKDNSITLPTRVELASPSGAMMADKMEIKENGKYILFNGNVEGYFYPSKPNEP